MSKMSAAKYLSSTLDAYGVSAVFLVPTILSKTLYHLEQDTSIDRILTHSEKAAAYMADGYARVTGTPGICMAQNIGAANLAAGLRDAYLGNSPVIALTGGPYEWSRGRNYYQEIEDFPLFKPTTKFSSQVYEAQRLPDMLAQAFRAATSGKPGPTHLELAGHSGDILEAQEFDAEIPIGQSFASPQLRVQPTTEAVAAAVQALLSAERPVVVSGGGVRASGARQELLALVERLGIPVATSLNGKDTVPGNHPLNVGVPGLYSRASANHTLLEADLVFYIGSETGSQVTLNWQVPKPSTRVIHLDIDPAELGRHYPNTVPLFADAKVGLQCLLDALGDADGERWAGWRARASELVQRWRDGLATEFTSEVVPMRPERLCAELSAHLPDRAILMSDTGHSGMWTGGYVDLNGSGQGFLRAAGSLGWGLPGAIGAQIGAPDRPVVLFTGDGGLWYHLSELETAARWKVPLTVVVNNNSSLNQEINAYTGAYGGSLHGRHGELWHFRQTDFAQVAETLGVRGLNVNKPSEFAPALEQAVESDGPTLIDVTTEIEALAAKGTTEPASP
jgi:acetolactate synthase-1/2/3 large subunit